MELYQIPLSADGAYDFDIELDSDLFNLGFHYNKRMERWIMDIRDLAGNSIVMGIPLLIGDDLLVEYGGSTLPKGEFYIVNYADQFENPNEDTLESDAFLFYLEVT